MTAWGWGAGHSSCHNPDAQSRPKYQLWYNRWSTSQQNRPPVGESCHLSTVTWEIFLLLKWGFDWYQLVATDVSTGIWHTSSVVMSCFFVVFLMDKAKEAFPKGCRVVWSSELVLHRWVPLSLYGLGADCPSQHMALTDTLLMIYLNTGPHVS